MYIPVLNANSVDPDQMPHSVASDLGLHCLLMSYLWDARVKLVKGKLAPSRANSFLLESIPFRKEAKKKKKKFKELTPWRVFPFNFNPKMP